MTVPSWTYFDPVRFERQMAATAAVKHGLIIAMACGWAVSILFTGTMAWVGLLLMAGGLIGWLIGNVISNRTGHMAITVAHLASDNPTSAELETALAHAMRRFTMYRTIRVMIYHQLAVLRHHRGQHDQTVAICQALLSMSNLGLSGGIRTRLLLLLADASMQRGDLMTTFHALTALAHCKLELMEKMQLLQTQTQYELACGYHRRALRALTDKIAIADMLPHDHAAEVHRLFAEAATFCGYTHTADWLTQRANLLEPEAPAL